VARHHTRLTPNHDQDAPVAEDKDENDDDRESREVSDVAAGNVVGISPFPENVQITTLVDILVVIKNIL